MSDELQDLLTGMGLVVLLVLWVMALSYVLSEHAEDDDFRG